MTVPDAGALARARDLAAAAARTPRDLILARFRSPDLRVETKSDGTPVTAVDRAAEAAIRDRLRGSAEFGAFEVLGEEGGREGKPAGYRWLIDPIDGTRAFARGIPTFGTIVALEECGSGRALAGAIHLPVTDETLAGARGLGAERGGRRLRASAATDLRTAIIALPDVAEFREAGMERAWAAVHAACERARGYTDCWAHALVIAGAVDAMLEAALSPWDVRATQVLVTEAGGAYRARPSRVEGRTDIVFGSPALVDRIAELAGFE
jgi:histidinol phosphatase-like enzyme (inositol monophosphatase family)